MKRAVILAAVLAASWPSLLHAQAQAQPPIIGVMRTPSGDTVPIPDPTASTVTLLNREIALLNEKIAATNAAIREVLDAELKALKNIIQLRDEKVDDAINVRTSQIEATQQESETRLADLRVLIDEKFKNVADLLLAKEKAAADALIAVNSTTANALTAAEKAVVEAGIVTKEKIDAQTELFAATTNGLRTSVDDLKASVAKLANASEVNALALRIAEIEARTAGLGEAKSAFGDNVGMFVGLGGLALALVIFVMGTRTRSPEIRYITAGAGQPTTTTAPHA